MSNKLILRAIDDHQKFKLVLRTVKAWAKLRLIHSRNSGFLNGIAWSILTARAWIKYNHLSAFEIIQNFFQDSTILEENEKIWLFEKYEVEETKIPDGANKPILDIPNLVYPYTNTTSNVTLTNRNILMEEFRRVNQIFENYKNLKMSLQDSKS